MGGWEREDGWMDEWMIACVSFFPSFLLHLFLLLAMEGGSY